VACATATLARRARQPTPQPTGTKTLAAGRVRARPPPAHRARRPTTSQRNARKCCRNCFSVSVCGDPPTSATMLQGKRPCSAVCLYRLFSTTCALVQAVQDHLRACTGCSGPPARLYRLFRTTCALVQAVQDHLRACTGCSGPPARARGRAAGAREHRAVYIRRQCCTV